MENIILDQQSQSFPQEPQNLSFESTQSSEPIQPNKEKNIYKILFFISIFVFLAIIIALYFVLNNKTNKLSSKESVENNQTQIESETATSADNVVLEYENVSFLLPKNSSVFLDPNHYVNKNVEGMGAAYTVQIDNSKYEVIFNNPTGIPECSGGEIECISEEITDLKNIEVFKIWRSNESFTMLNPTLINGDISATIKNISNPSKSTFTTDEIEMWKNIFSNSVQKTVIDNSELKKSVDSILINKDINNNLYTNNKFGFSLTLPKKLIIPKCLNTNNTYSLDIRNNFEYTDLTFFEEGNTLYFSGKEFNKLTGEQKNPSVNGGYYNPTYFGCNKNIKTIGDIKNDHFALPVLKIYMGNAKNNQELEEFVKSKYGSACKIGNQTKLNQEGVYQVEILTDGKSLDVSKCPINFIISLKYSPIKGKIVLTELGQACNLMKNLEDNSIDDCFDHEIVDSLKFN